MGCRGLTRWRTSASTTLSWSPRRKKPRSWSSSLRPTRCTLPRRTATKSVPLATILPSQNTSKRTALNWPTWQGFGATARRVERQQQLATDALHASATDSDTPCVPFHTSGHTLGHHLSLARNGTIAVGRDTSRRAAGAAPGDQGVARCHHRQRQAPQAASMQPCSRMYSPSTARMLLPSRTCLSKRGHVQRLKGTVWNPSRGWQACWASTQGHGTCQSGQTCCRSSCSQV